MKLWKYIVLPMLAMSPVISGCGNDGNPGPDPGLPAPGTPGQAAYNSKCSGCHRLGNYDTGGSAPDLAGKGGKIASKFTPGVPGHKGITLSAEELPSLQTFVNTF